MSYAEHFATHLRLAMLRVLEGAPACRANSSILHSAVQDLGLSASRDLVRTQIAWLDEQGLVTSAAAGDLVVVTLTERGLDVARGLVVVYGVARPTPRG